MKKTAALILVLCLLVSCVPAAYAADVPSGDIQDILTVMGVMTKDAGGNFRAGETLTRAQLAKILVTMSSYKSLVSASARTSPFSDVKYSHWASPYISVASAKGIMTGYTNGAFRPEQRVLYEEAVTAILRMLGYTNTEFIGGYPFGQLFLAADIGLTEHVGAVSGSALTRQQTAQLVYNALCTKIKDSDKTYAENIGYSLTNGVLTIGDAMSVNVKGPVTVTSDSTLGSLGLNLSTATVYIDQSASDASAIKTYDIIYYSVSGNTIWAYTDKASGVVDSISPNREAPATVTISGTSYTLSSYPAQKAFGIGGFETGQLVTVLLDRNGQVADAYQTEDIYKEQIGVVIEAGSKQLSGSDTGYAYYITVLLSGGGTCDMKMSSDSESLVGRAVRIVYASGDASVSLVTGNSGVYGMVKAESYTIGSGSSKGTLASGVSIVEYDAYGNTLLQSLSRIDGVTLEKSDIALLSYDSAGKIDSIILKDVTGDMAKYGTVLSAKEKSGSMSQSGTYEYDIAGAAGTYSVSSGLLNIGPGPSAFYYEGGQIQKIKNLTKLDKTVTSLNASYLQTSDGQKYKVSAKVVVYKLQNAQPLLSTLEEAMTQPGSLSAYYDKAQAEGGLIRVLYID